MFVLKFLALTVPLIVAVVSGFLGYQEVSAGGLHKGYTEGFIAMASVVVWWMAVVWIIISSVGTQESSGPG